MKFVLGLALFGLTIALASAGTSSFVQPVPLRDMQNERSEIELEGRITNGQRATDGQYPYQVGLSIRVSALSSSWCGGSLIGTNWVLTATHCVVKAESVTVYLGNTKRATGTSRTVSASSIIMHPGYSSTYLTNDISLLKISTVQYSGTIKPVALPKMSSSYSTYSGQQAIISGWGRTSDSSSVSSDLNFAKATIIPNTDCSKVYGTSVVTSKVICISTPKGVSTCQGDSGGPLVIESSKQLVGVTSFVSSSGCTAGMPSGFTRVTSYLDWIKSNTNISY